MSGESEVGTEFADRGRPASVFPDAWGAAPGGRWSEERAQWVSAHVRRHVGDPVRHLLKVQRIHLNDLTRELIRRRVEEGRELDARARAKGLL